MDRIKEAAMLRQGVIWTGRRHHNIIHDIVTKTGERPAKGIQGFITDEGKFVDRKEGARIALESGQIAKLKWPPDLYSEDLY